MLTRRSSRESSKSVRFGIYERCCRRQRAPCARLETLRHTIASTGVLTHSLAPFDLGGPEPLADDAPARTRVFLEHLDRLAAKDLDSALALAGSVQAELPVFETVRRAFRRVARLDPWSSKKKEGRRN